MLTVHAMRPLMIFGLIAAFFPDNAPARAVSRPPAHFTAPGASTRAVTPSTPQVLAPQLVAPQPAAPSAAPPVASMATPPAGLLAAVTLADIGFGNGFRFANLGGRREVFVPMPQGPEVKANALDLVIDDVSAHEARRNLEVLVNDRSAVALVLDGKSRGRDIRVPLAGTKAKDGFLKLTFLYSGASTPDRCIDVHAVGDSLTIRPETAIEMDVGANVALDVATTTTLMPRDVTVVLPGRRLAASELATALIVARNLLASGRHVGFQQGYDELPELAKRQDGSNRWTHGLVIIGSPEMMGGLIDGAVATVAGPPVIGALAAIRIGGAPALLVSDGAAGRLLASPLLPATRGVTAASVGDMAPDLLSADRVTFDDLGVAPIQADVFGRAELITTIDTRRLLAGRYPARLLLDMMIAPDGSGEKAVVSAYVNERLLGSIVAAVNGPTRLDLTLPDGLVGTGASIRAVVQRPSAQGDCRLEPQGYPAQILGSSAFELAAADTRTDDFSDLAIRWAKGLEVLLPEEAAERPARVLGLVAGMLNLLSAETTPLTVSLVPRGSAPAPTGPYIAVNDIPPAGGAPRVRFDRGRIAVDDRSGRTLLDLGGFTAGAVAQITTGGEQVGLWIRSLARDGALPQPADLKLDRGDVAFLDRNGVALAMSTERDTLIRVSYPDQVSWLSVAERFRSWIIAGLWLLATLGVLFVLQRMFRRRPAAANDE